MVLNCKMPYQLKILRKNTTAPFSYNWNLQLSGFTCENLFLNMYINLRIFVMEHLLLQFEVANANDIF